jgi:small-conductance mechanosensitive channel
MTGVDLIFQLFALLLGFSVAELLAGMARTWRIKVGATRAGEAQIRIGWLAPLLASLVMIDQTHFWLTAYQLKDFFVFDYATLLAILVIIGGYYIISTFVFPDDPEHWPDFDEYYLRTNRTVLAGMIAINLLTFGYALDVAFDFGLEINAAPVMRSWFSFIPAMFFFPCLVILWFVKSRRANLLLLSGMNALLLIGAIGPKLFEG